VIAATARSLSDGWLPAGDQANIAIRAFDVLTSRSPLLGLHSDVSQVTHHAVYSLGPMLFWLLALPSHFGSTGTMVLTMGIVNSAAIVGSVVLARRRGGRALMLISAVALVLMARSLAPEVLHDVWNPSAGLFPFTLLIFLCWSLACGEYRLLPVTVLVVSFVVQCQLAFVPPCLGLLAVGLVGLGVSLRSSPRRPAPASDAAAEPPPSSTEPAPSGRRVWWRWALATLLVAVVCWTPPVIDQIEGNPGNLTAVVRTAKANPPSLGDSVGWHAVVRAVGIRPWWLRDPASPWERKNEVRVASSSAATVSTILTLLALVGLAVAGVLRREAELWTGALIALALCAGLAFVAASTPTLRVLAETLGYTLWWASPAGMFVWVVTAWGVLRTLARVARSVRRPHDTHRAATLPRAALPRWPAGEAQRGATGASALASVIGLLVLVAASAAVAGAERPDYHLSEYRPVATISTALERGVPRGRTVLLIGALGSETFRFKMAARFALVRRGIRPLSPGKDVRLGSWYEQDHHPYDCVVYLEDGTARPVVASPPSPARAVSSGASRRVPAARAVWRAHMIARVGFDDDSAVLPLSVWTAPAGCPRLAPGAAHAG
jgi:hypothetical protein